ncbi:MAG: MFS transporter [Wenzhouxiangella sp.]|nr:MFS transporter [Wenzhouxiangella sp.]
MNAIIHRVRAVPAYGWFALFAALASSFGQTFFIGLFGGEIQAALGLDPAGLGYLYGSATLFSGVLMFWLGALADRLALSRGIGISLGVLALGCVGLANTHNSAMLWVSFFLVRLGGQGLTGHLAIVAAARHAIDQRGRTVAMASYGFILAEAIFPVLVAQLLGLIDWRVLWWLAAGLVALVAWPGLRALSARFAHLDLIKDNPNTRVDSHPATRPTSDLTRWTLLRQPLFYLTLPMVLGSAFVITALFLHQGSLAAIKGWALADVGRAFVLFALAQASSAFVTGRLIDAFGSLGVLRFFLWPMVASVGVLGWSAGPFDVWGVFVGLGLTAGANGVVSGAVWAELFGVRQLGMIRGVYSAFMVIASAIAPMLLGAWLSVGWSLAPLAWLALVYGVVLPQALVMVIRKERATAGPTSGSR